MRNKNQSWDDKWKAYVALSKSEMDRLEGDETKSYVDEMVDKDTTLDSKQDTGKMVEVWARIGMILELTEKEYDNLLKSQHGDGKLMRRLAREGRIRPEGESYTPQHTEVNGKEIRVELTYDDNWTLKGRD